MKKAKIFIPVLIVLIGIGIVVFDESNTTVEDVIYQQSAIDNTSPVDKMIGKVQSGDVSLYVYFTEDNRIGFSTIKENSSFYNKYSLCSVENISKELLISRKEIIGQYNEQQLDFNYGIIANPQNDTIDYNGQSYDLEILECDGLTLGVFLHNNL